MPTSRCKDAEATPPRAAKRPASWLIARVPIQNAATAAAATSAPKGAHGRRRAPLFAGACAGGSTSIRRMIFATASGDGAPCT
ncbi:hypothetical protein QHF89_49740, partial [Polyangium sorediatum]